MVHNYNLTLLEDQRQGILRNCIESLALSLSYCKCLETKQGCIFDKLTCQRPPICDDL